MQICKQIRAAALALATKVDRGEMSREGATLQLVQMQFGTLADHRAAVQGAAPDALVVSLFSPFPSDVAGASAAEHNE